MELKSVTATLFLAIFQTIFVAEARGPQQVSFSSYQLSFDIFLSLTTSKRILITNLNFERFYKLSFQILSLKNSAEID